jgi:hypothetical protein
MRIVPIAFFASCLSLGALGAACGSSSSGSAAPTADAGGAIDSSATGDDAATTGDDGGDGGDAAVGYPAVVPTNVPQVTSETGPVMTAPKIVPIFYAADESATIASLTDFSNKIGQTQYWTKLATEYGSAAATSLTPIQLTDVLPESYDDSQIQAYLANALESGDPRFPAADENTLYAFYFPPGVTITTGATVATGDGGVDGGDDGGGDAGVIDAGGFGGGVSSSCTDFGGYHDNIQLDANHNNLNVAYAVIPRCSSFGPLTGLDAITGPASHEYMEAVTDPFPDSTSVMPAYVTVDEEHFYWESMLGGGEVGDMCAQNGGAFVKFPELPLYTVQRIWSNLSAKAGADPCEPLLPTYTYINAIPVLPDTLMLTTRGSTVNTKGIHIPVGMSATIEVDLVSSGPTGPWTVSAIDQAGYRGQTPDLTFVWDKTTGQNGDKLHLTITTVTAGRRNYVPFLILSDQGTTENIWAGVVGN